MQAFAIINGPVAIGGTDNLFTLYILERLRDLYPLIMRVGIFAGVPLLGHVKPILGCSPHKAVPLPYKRLRLPMGKSASSFRPFLKKGFVLCRWFNVKDEFYTALVKRNEPLLL